MMPEPACPVAPLVVRGALAAHDCARWRRRIEEASARLPDTDADVQPTSGSLRLPALGPAAFGQMLEALWAGPAGAALRERLAPGAVCLSGQCWARRQYPGALRPPGQHPHGWHQDGALGCRFGGGESGAPAEALAPLITAWVPLVDCGDDAPSLEWIEAEPATVLQPAELEDAALGLRWGHQARRHACLSAGDALIFGPALVHRSFVRPSMRRQRLSVEWRFATAGSLPLRLAAEPLVALPG